MTRSFPRALVAALLLTATSQAQVLVVPCQAPSPLLPDGWTVDAKRLGWDSQGVFVRALTHGNCRIEIHEECFPAPGGGTVCRRIPKEVCDEGMEKFRFAPEVVTVVNEKWIYHTRAEGAPVIFGQAFKTFPYWEIVEWRGATLALSDETGCALSLDLEKLGQAGREARFAELFGGRAE